MVKYTEEKIDQEHKRVPLWEVKERSKIVRTFTFDQYLEGIEFVRKIGTLADEKDHHPFIEVDYGKITVSLTSHDVSGLTERDFDLARAYDQTYENKDF